MEHGRHRPQQPALPAARLRLDGLAPWNVGATGPTVPRTNITWNQYASEWAVDVKSNRKLEELNETLWLSETRPVLESVPTSTT